VPAVAGIGTLAFIPRHQEGTIPQGVQVAGMDWGGKSESVARAELETWRKSRLGQKVTLKLPAEAKSSRKWTVRRADLGADIDVDATLTRASDLQGESPLERLASWVTAPKPVKLEPVWTIDAKKIEKYLKANVAKRVYRIPQNARLVALEEGFKKVEEKPGTELDLAASTASVTERIPDSGDEAVVLSLKEAKPNVTLADLEGIDEEIARFRTSHSSGGNRASNIRLACTKMNGVVLKPGDVFSYNKVIGRREREDGYRVAPVISDGRLQPGMAGGVCQTSSTLYNAVLLADLKVLKRSHHTFPVRYLAAGRDATVAWGSIDLQFQNSTDGPIALMADGSRGQVLVRIFGRKDAGKSVQVTSSRSGLHATVWRTVKQDGKVVRRELVSRDHYKPVPPKEPTRQRLAARRLPRTQRASTRPTAPVIPASTATIVPAVHSTPTESDP